MIQRDRAWRRRKTRIVLRRETEQKEAVSRPSEETEVIAIKEDKHHRPGALTHAQDLRMQSALGDELREVEEAE